MIEQTPNPTAVVAGRLVEVLDMDPEGYILVKDLITLESVWRDYYLVNYIDPNENPGAVLEAMSTLLNKDETDDLGVEDSHGA